MKSPGGSYSVIGLGLAHLRRHPSNQWRDRVIVCVLILESEKMHRRTMQSVIRRYGEPKANIGMKNRYARTVIQSRPNIGPLVFTSLSRAEKQSRRNMLTTACCPYFVQLTWGWKQPRCCVRHEMRRYKHSAKPGISEITPGWKCNFLRMQLTGADWGWLQTCKLE